MTQKHIMTILMLASFSSLAWTFDSGTIESGEVLEQPMDDDALIDDNRLLSGVVLGRTITPLGNEFRDHLGEIWKDMNIEEAGILSVEERPSTNLGSQIIVRYEREIILQAVLPPNRDPSPRQYAQLAAQRAARIVRTQIGSGNNPDLAEEEL